MKRLYLLRHAKSSWDQPGLADRDRPLAPRGRRASKAMAKHLREEHIAPELVLCSPARRTRETLERIGIDDSRVRVEADLYGASAGDLLAVLNRMGDDVDSVMVIAHSPGVQDLVIQLAGPGPEIARVRQKYPTAALATLELDGTWAELSPGSAELVAFVMPKELSGSA